jgi:DNA polymerase-3 subunit epsilon
MFRELIFDTETTGLYENKGDRIIEIGLLEVVDMNLTGRQFHCYLNPEGSKSNPFAQKVHGIGHEFLQDKPLFQSIADELLAFIGKTT